MEYGLVRGVLGANTFLSIEEHDLLEIKNAKEGLLHCVSIEEKFDLVVENMLELETSLLEAATRHMWLRDSDWHSFQSGRNLFNRRLVNLLTAARTYIDHTAHHVKKIYEGDSASEVKHVKELFHREYDGRLGYRSAEALRNYVQHRGFPIHSVTFDSRIVESEEVDSASIRFGVTPYLRPTALREDRGFKKSVLAELEMLGERIDLKLIVRDYVEGLASVHQGLRRKIGPKVGKWEGLITEMIERFRDESSDGEVTGLTAVKRDDDGLWLDSVPIFQDVIDYRKALVKKNAVLQNISRRYVTSELINNK